MSRYRLYIIITCFFGILIIVGGYFTTTLIEKKINQNLVGNYAIQEETLAGNIAKTLQYNIQSTENELYLMGKDPEIENSASSTCVSEIKRDLSLTGSDLGNIGRVDKNGIFSCSLNPKLIGTKADALGPYMDQIFNDPNHSPVMSRAINVPGASSTLVALHVPVRSDTGEFEGTLGGAIYLQDLQNKYLKDVTFAKQGFVILLDDNGTILYHKNQQVIGKSFESADFKKVVNDITPFEQILADAKLGNSGIKEYVNATQGVKVAGYVPITIVPGRTWIVMVTVPISDVQSELKDIGVSSLLFELWLLVALVVIAAETALIILTERLVFKPLREVEAMKTDFVSLVSHQLKTPVAQVKGYVENMLDGLTGPINDKQKDYLEDMLNVANKNSKLIDDLLNISRIERRMLKVNLEPLVINDLLLDVLAPLREVALKKGVRLEENLLKKPVTIMGDSVKTREAIRNIIDNAIKFTDAGKMVMVAASTNSEKVQITVSDEGMGIDPDVQTELFKKNRVWAGKVKASGAGLGLYLSKQFIELTGGTISFSSKLGKGTVFIITFNQSNGKQA